MQLCDNEGAPNPDGLAQTGHATVACIPDSDKNVYASPNKNNSHYFGLGPGQGFMEMQFYPPGWASWPAGLSCTATQWCSALNIDTFQDNANTGALNNNDCLNTVGPEPVNFAFTTKTGVASAPANPQHPDNFTPDLKNDFLTNSGDVLRVHMSDTAHGLKVTVDDLTTGTHGSMTASAANGFGSPIFAPNASKCTVALHDFHPMYSTATQAGRNFNAAHTGNISFSDEIGHFEYCAKVRNDAIASCANSLGDDTNDGRRRHRTRGRRQLLPARRPRPPGSRSVAASTPTATSTRSATSSPGQGRSATHVADQLLNASPVRFTSPTHERQELRDHGVRVEHQPVGVRRHRVPRGRLLPAAHHEPSGPAPRGRLREPATELELLPLLQHHHASGGTCWWQQGGPYIPGTTNKFGGSAPRSTARCG